MKNTIIITITFLFIVIGSKAQNAMDDKIKTLANEIADQVAKSGKKTVAVAIPTYKKSQTEFGEYIAEKLSGKLATSNRGISVVNQKMLAELLKQNKLTAEGLLVAKNDAAKIGQASGIEALAYGVITSFGEELQLTINIVELKTTNVFGNSETTFPLTNAIKNMLIPSEDNKEPIIDTYSPTTLNLSKPPADCKEKNICVVCVKNIDNESVEVKGNFNVHDNNYNKSKLIHFNKTECWQNVLIGTKGEDYKGMNLYFYTNGRKIKDEKFNVEACMTKVIEYKK